MEIKYSCVVPGCPATYKINGSNKRFFNFPSNAEFRNKWINIITTRYAHFEPKKTMKICQDHFTDKNFTDTLHGRLLKFAEPDIFENNSILTESLVEKTPVKRKLDFTSEPSTSALSVDDMEYVDIEETQPKKLKKGILSRININRVSTLTPRKRYLYKETRKQQSQIIKLKTTLTNSKNKLKTALHISKTKMFENLEKSFNTTGVNFIKSQFNNANKQKHGERWTIDDKVFALAIYKRGPRCYRFLERFVKLPSKSTIQTILSSVTFDSGINEQILNKLKTRVMKMPKMDRYCCLMFDEMSLSYDFTYDHKLSKVIGYVDLGSSVGRFNEPANHALVFMIAGLHKFWKQPLAYYFTKDQVKTVHLKRIIKEIISALQEIGLKIICCVCDQGTTNAAALKQLVGETVTDRPGPYFQVNNEDIVVMHDPPHLLKNVRNALKKYDIKFSDNKVAKWEHLVECYNVDKSLMFQMLHKIKEEYLTLPQSQMKMKVSVAAKTLSHTMAAAISVMSINLLPSEALHTAEFVGKIDKLFDSVNGTTQFPDKGKEFRCRVSPKTKHLTFWYDMLEEIKTWQFIDRKTGKSVNSPRCKQGWIQSLEGIIMVWKICRNAGFKSLRTRSLNQDPIENLFGVIRQHGGPHSNPSCYQFVSALKTSILNGLVAPPKRGANCEDDGADVLDNLKDFLHRDPAPSNEISSPQKANEEPCEILSEIDLNPHIPDTVNVAIVDEIQDMDLSFTVSEEPHIGCLTPNECTTEVTTLTDSNFIDQQALLYVSGYFAKKVLQNKCQNCKDVLLSKDILPEHTFTMFKEYQDNKNSLQYATKELSSYVSQSYKIIYDKLPKEGHTENIYNKLLTSISDTIPFGWFTCDIHRSKIKLFLIKVMLNTIFRKYFKYYKSKLAIHKENRVKKFLHI